MSGWRREETLKALRDEAHAENPMLCDASCGHISNALDIWREDLLDEAREIQEEQRVRNLSND